MHFHAHGRPISEDTPCPGAVRTLVVLVVQVQQHIPHVHPPHVDHPAYTYGTCTSFVAPPTSETRPSVSTHSSAPPTHPEATATSVPQSGYPSLLCLLPLFSLVPGQHVSLRAVVPLLQASLHGIVNDNICSYNETKDALFSALGLPPMPSRPLYISSYQIFTSTPASPTPQPTCSRRVHFSEDAPTPHIITSAALSEALAGISISPPASDTTFAVVSELISDIAASSRVVGSPEPELSADVPEDAPIYTQTCLLHS